MPKIEMKAGSLGQCHCPHCQGRAANTKEFDYDPAVAEVDSPVLLHIAGFAGKEAQIPRVVKMAMIEDTKALRAQLLQWAEIESLKRILVSHGSAIEENPRQTLRDLASSLA